MWLAMRASRAASHSASVVHATHPLRRWRWAASVDHPSPSRVECRKENKESETRTEERKKRERRELKKAEERTPKNSSIKARRSGSGLPSNMPRISHPIHPHPRLWAERESRIERMGKGGVRMTRRRKGRETKSGTRVSVDFRSSASRTLRKSPAHRTLRHSPSTTFPDTVPKERKTEASTEKRTPTRDAGKSKA
ncbi:hypothetical protein B0H14DRAFT_2736405 [Mycena olivaceomarginata]|nr:hypothetical protein B0H14DRAFT_2736405 [Mycena olivaceomarginata]